METFGEKLDGTYRKHILGSFLLQEAENGAVTKWSIRRVFYLEWEELWLVCMVVSIL